MELDISSFAELTPDMVTGKTISGHLGVHRNQLSVQPAWDFHWPWLLSKVIRFILSLLWIYTVKQL
jgi:hypothetical protein